MAGWTVRSASSTTCSDGHRYIDGGVASATSLGLLARPGAPVLDEVFVLAPLASHDYDRPRGAVAVPS